MLSSDDSLEREDYKNYCMTTCYVPQLYTVISNLTGELGLLVLVVHAFVN